MDQQNMTIKDLIVLVEQYGTEHIDHLEHDYTMTLEDWVHDLVEYAHNYNID